jgi:hypothetical protein
MTQNASVQRAQNQAEQASQEASPWIDRLGRFGYTAKGVVYAIVGVLAFQAAIGSGGQTTGSSGALQSIANQPFGQLLLGLVAIGLAGYVVWRFAEAIADPENKGTDAKGIATRIGYVVSGILYGFLAFTAVQIIMGNGGGGGGSSTESFTARLMSQPFGQWLVGIVGVITIAAGFEQLQRAYKASFRKKFKLQDMSPTEQTWSTRLGRFGLSARGLVWTMIGIFFIVAAYQAQPQEAEGLAQVLQTLVQQPFGPWLLGIVALGLVAYGIFMVIQARYRRMIET